MNNHDSCVKERNRGIVDTLLIGKNLRRLRKERGYRSYPQFAKAFNCSDETVKKWENESVGISLGMLVRLADFLDCDIDYLLGRIETYRKETTDICAATGLSVPAVEALLDHGAGSIRQETIDFLSAFIPSAEYIQMAGILMAATKYANIAYNSSSFPTDSNGNTLSDDEKRKICGELWETNKDAVTKVRAERMNFLDIMGKVFDAYYSPYIDIVSVPGEMMARLVREEYVKEMNRRKEGRSYGHD